MSDAFEFNVITMAGASLIAQATSSNPIVIVDARSGTQAASSPSDLASKDISFYDGIVGTIASSSATNNVAKIVTKFGNAGSSPQIVKSVALRAKLQSQSVSDAVIIAAMSDPDSEIYFPSSESPKQIIRIVFTIAVNGNNTVETVYADGATIADLDRFVSTHEAGNPTEGENQTIYGNKTFAGDIHFKDDLVSNIGTLGRRPKTIYANTLDANYLYLRTLKSCIIDCSIFVEPSNTTASIGTYAKPVPRLYADNIKVINKTITQDLDVINGDIATLRSTTFRATNADLTYIKADQIGGSTNQGFLYLNTDLKPNVNGNLSIGDATHQLDELYAMHIYAVDVSCRYMTGIVRSLYYGNGNGALAEIFLTSSSAQYSQLVRGSTVYDGMTTSEGSLSVTLDGATAPGKWAVLNLVNVNSSGAKVMAVRTE